MKLHLYVNIGIANYLQEHKPFYYPEMKIKLITVNFVCSNNMMLIEGTRWSSL